MYFDLAPSPDIPQPRQGPIFSMREFVRERSFYFGCSVERVRGPAKNPSIVRIRRAIAMELRECGHSLPEIGRAMNRDHSSIWSLLRGGKRK